MAEPVTRDAAAAAVERLGRRGRWVVLRHGGRSNNEWRELGSWASDYAYGEGCAANMFRETSRSIRQGGVALVSPAGDVSQFDSAPMLRTRW